MSNKGDQVDQVKPSNDLDLVIAIQGAMSLDPSTAAPR